MGLVQPDLSALQIASDGTVFDKLGQLQTLGMRKKQGDLADTNLKLSKLKLQEYEEDTPNRKAEKALQQKVAILSTDKEFQQHFKEQLASIDPNAEDFNEQMFKNLADNEKIMVERYGFTPQESEMATKQLVMSGATSQKGVMASQVKLGLRKPEQQQIVNGKLVTINDGKASAQSIPGMTGEQQIVNGQLVTLQDGNATAKPIEGLKMPVKEPGTQLGKLVMERDKLPAGHPDRPLYEMAIAKENAANKGMQLVTHPDGSVEFSQGGSDISGLDKATKGKVGAGMLSSSNLISGLNSTKEAFNADAEKYLTAAGKATLSALVLKEKAGATLSQDETEYVKNSTKFAERAFVTVNTVLKDMAGTAVTDQEMERQLKTLPNPGKEGFSNILTGDSATQFTTKINDAIKMQQLALARLSYVNSNGFKIEKDDKGKATAFLNGDNKPINIDDMPKIMKAKANEMGKKIMLENPGASKEAVSALLKQQIAEEFGLVQ